MPGRSNRPHFVFFTRGGRFPLRQPAPHCVSPARLAFVCQRARAAVSCVQSPLWEVPMPQASAPLDSLLVTVVLATLALGVPFVFVLSIRFLWDRKLNLGRSKELEKLIWQLHRIASALEHQMNLAFPPVHPGTEEPRDLAFLQQIASPTPAATPSVAAS